MTWDAKRLARLTLIVGAWTTATFAAGFGSASYVMLAHGRAIGAAALELGARVSSAGTPAHVEEAQPVAWAPEPTSPVVIPQRAARVDAAKAERVAKR